jgi:ABC-type dipeptide/oligopeptide/nickel transport system permease subunit
MFDPRTGARFLKNRGAVVGGALVVLLVAFAIVAPLVCSHDPMHSDFDLGMTPDMTPSGPGGHYLFGADRLFRDELVRLAFGARLSLVIAVSATLISSFIGALVGVVSGYYAGTQGICVPWASVVAFVGSVALLTVGRPHGAGAAAATGIVLVVISGTVRAAPALLRSGPRLNADSALMRVVDVGLAFPFLLLVMAIGAALDRTTATTILVTLGLTGWLGAARVLRAKTLQVRNLEFVVAARALGQSTPAILARHVLPNVLGPLIVIATISVAQMIVAEAVLSYLGVGISPPTPTLGHMLFEGQDYYLAAPWLLLAPGTAILLAVFGFNLLGEGLRDALDPQED